VDYIAEKMNISYSFDNKKNTLEAYKNKMLKIYNEKIPKENLKEFVEEINSNLNLCKNINNNKNSNTNNNNKTYIDKVFFIERRSLCKFNFSIEEQESNIDKLNKFNNTFKLISKEIQDKFPRGEIIKSENFNIFNKLNFAFLKDELELKLNINENINTDIINANKKPKESFAYLSENNSILVLFNSFDHIQVILLLDNYKNDYDINNIIDDYKQYEAILDIIKPYAIFDEFFGNLLKNPLNSGSSFEIRLMMNNNFSFDNNNRNIYEEIKPLIREFSLNRTPVIFNSFYVYNKIKANYLREEILKKFLDFIKKINLNLNLNQNLNSNSNLDRNNDNNNDNA
jgi:hypothetical protein